MNLTPRLVVRTLLALTILTAGGCRDEGLLLDTVKLESVIESSLSLDGEKVDGLRSTIEREAMEARRITARELQRPSFLRDEEAVIAAWSRAVRLAGEYASIARSQRQVLEASWQESSARAREALDQARASADRLNGRRIASNLRRAEDSLAVALRLGEEGDLRGAIAYADRSLEASSTVQSLAGSAHERFNDPELLRLWAGWVNEAIELSRRRSVIIVDKLARKAHVYRDTRRVESFPVELGSAGLNRKLYAGDRATPEGMYRIVEVRKAPATRFYRALVLDYPNSEDRRRFDEARRAGRIPSNAPIGGLIEIHGEGGRDRDWTNGCVALRNDQMDRLVTMVSEGTPVAIVGRMP